MSSSNAVSEPGIPMAHASSINADAFEGCCYTTVLEGAFGKRYLIKRETDQRRLYSASRQSC